MNPIKKILDTKVIPPTKKQRGGIKNRGQEIACKIAEDFDEMDKISMYMRFVKMYGPDYVKRIWNDVQKFDNREKKIKIFMWNMKRK